MCNNYVFYTDWYGSWQYNVGQFWFVAFSFFFPQLLVPGYWDYLEFSCIFSHKCIKTDQWNKKKGLSVRHLLRITHNPNYNAYLASSKDIIIAISSNGHQGIAAEGDGIAAGVHYDSISVTRHSSPVTIATSPSAVPTLTQNGLCMCLKELCHQKPFIGHVSSHTDQLCVDNIRKHFLKMLHSRRNTLLQAISGCCLLWTCHQDQPADLPDCRANQKMPLYNKECDTMSNHGNSNTAESCH